MKLATSMKHKNIKSLLLFAGSLTFVFFLFCINFNNPYKDDTKARILLLNESHRTIHVGDTIVTDTVLPLFIAVELFEYISQIKIQIEHSPQWNDSVIPVDQLLSNPLGLTVNFSDVGIQKISLTTFFSDGDLREENYYARVFYTTQDTVPPEITITDPVPTDKVIEPQGIPFTLKVKFHDAASAIKLSTIMINNTSFDSSAIQDAYTVLGYKTFFKNDFESHAIPIHIFVEDTNKNSRVNQYWIFYDTVTHTVPHIIRTNPYIDTTIVNTDSLVLYGLIEGITENVPYYLFIKHDGVFLPDSQAVTKQNNIWQRRCKLNESWNTFSIELYKTSDKTGQPLDSNTCAVRYMITDTIAGNPIINAVTSNGTKLPQYTPLTDLPITVVAFDTIVGLKHVRINDSIATVVGLNSYEKSIHLVHAKAGNKIVVTAVNRMNKIAEKRYDVFHNNKAYFTRIPLIDSLEASKPFVDTVTAADADNDTIQLSASIYHGKQDTSYITIDSKGHFTWTPGITDTLGMTTITFHVFDGFELCDSTCSFKVVPPLPDHEIKKPFQQ